jgi:hypothetical protein
VSDVGGDKHCRIQKNGSLDTWESARRDLHHKAATEAVSDPRRRRRNRLEHVGNVDL